MVEIIKVDSSTLFQQIASEIDEIKKKCDIQPNDDIIVNKCTALLLDLLLASTDSLDDINKIFNVAKELYLEHVVKFSIFPHKLMQTLFSLTQPNKWRKYFPAIRYVFSMKYEGLNTRIATQIAVSIFNLMESKIRYTYDPEFLQELNVLELEILGMGHECMVNKRNDVYRDPVNFIDIPRGDNNEDSTGNSKETSMNVFEDDGGGSDDGEIVEEDTVFTQLGIVLHTPKSYKRYLEDDYNKIVNFLNDPYKITQKDVIEEYCNVVKAFLGKLNSIKCDRFNGEFHDIKHIYENINLLYTGVDFRFRKFSNPSFRLVFCGQLRIVNNYLYESSESEECKLKESDLEKLSSLEDVLTRFMKNLLHDMGDLRADDTYHNIMNHISNEKLFFAIKNRKKAKIEGNVEDEDCMEEWPRINNCFNILKMSQAE
uniref:CID domain-containing protein n=1 Tax=Strongyloides papillosus TaxID=174720 RepID=A0A0N5B840_STREA